MLRRPVQEASTMPLRWLYPKVVAIALLTCQVAADETAARKALPRIVAESLAREGFRQITNVRVLGPSLVAHAISSNGLPARLVIDSDSGRILGFRLLDPEPLSRTQP